MDSTPHSSPLMRRTNFVLIVLFMLLLWLPTLDSIFHFDWTKPRSENRAIAAFPKLHPGWEGFQAYLAGLEAYFNDHFGTRKCLVQWNNKLRWSLFKDKTNRSVLTGKDGWLFFTDARMIDHYSGQLQFTPEQLHDWQMVLERRRNWLARRGIAYLFVIAPDKHTIYPEELPDWLTKVSPQTKVDQFFTYMREHSTVPVLDLRDVVRDAKKLGPTYLKTDTHWNCIGGFAAYQLLMQEIARLMPALKLGAMPRESFTLTNTLTHGGDLARILGVSMTESNAFSMIPNLELPVFSQKLPPEDHPKEPAFSSNPSAKGSLMLYHDSFSGAWNPFLGYHFNQITYLWQYDLDTAWVERDKPDIVVTEMLERFFNTEDPKKLMVKEALF